MLKHRFFESDNPVYWFCGFLLHSQFELLGSHHCAPSPVILPLLGSQASLLGPLHFFPTKLALDVKVVSQCLASEIVSTGTNSDTEMTWQVYNKMIQKIDRVIFKITKMKWHNFLRICWDFWQYVFWPIRTHILHWANGIKLSKLSKKQNTYERNYLSMYEWKW